MIDARALLAVICTVHVTSASALCIYGGAHFEKSSSPDFGGRLYAKTTVADADLVIRGTVLSSRDVYRPPHLCQAKIGVLYRVRIDQTFKGRSGPTVLDFSGYNSGAFYLDVGTNYLLFLNPKGQADEWAAWPTPDVFEINYSCGQSRPWSQVSADARKLLERPSRMATP